MRRACTLALVALVATAGCFWHRYPGRMGVHCDLLVAYARKARDLVRAGRFSAESLPELVYPLERARAFAAEARARAAAPPPSLAAFETLLGRYRDLVELVDRGRHEPPGPAAAQALDDAVGAVESAADATRAALAAEHRPDRSLARTTVRSTLAPSPDPRRRLGSAP